MNPTVFVTQTETPVPEHAFIYSKTDPKGKIIEANEDFATLSGYSVEEMIGKPHNLVRHPDMPREAFADMWKSLKGGRPWRGMVKNRRKDGGFYWVFATVSPVRGEGNRVVGFQSLRNRPSREAVKAAEDAYRRIRQGDKSLLISEGRIERNSSVLVRAIARPDLRLALAPIFGLAASCIGLAFTYQESHASFLRIPAVVAFILSALASLLVLLDTLPHLLRDLDQIETFLDRLLSTGDFTTVLELGQRGRSARIARKFSLLSGWVQTTIRCILESVISVQSGTEKIRLAIRGIDEAAATQNMSTASVAAATTQLDLTIREVTQHLQVTEATVQETGRKAADGAAISDRVAGSIKELAKAVHVATVEVEALGKSSAEVGAIANVIRGIADQTNLLALNASIEAARAGAAGRGFAVVANEVRSLADRTRKATVEIDGLIETIKADSERAIAGMRNGTAQVTNGVALVEEARAALNGIDSLMTEAVRKVSEIATSSSQQTGAIGEISSNITQVASMTERNVTVVQETTKLIGDLGPMVVRVKDAVDQYHV